MKTPNLALNTPDFDVSPWHDLVNNNFLMLDAIIHTMFGITNVKGVYANSTAVSAGERYVDAVTTEIYEVVVDYVTAPAPMTFSGERAANPTKWLLVDANAALNGLAQMLTIRNDVFTASNEVNTNRAAVEAIIAQLHMPAVATIGGSPITITDWDNAKNFPNTVIYAGAAASLLSSGFEYGVVGSPGRAGLGFYYSIDANNGYIIIVAMASGNRWYRRYEGGTWQAWSKNPNMNEIVRRDFVLTGNAEAAVDTATTQGGDLYKIAAGASNLPSWASIGDVMLATNTGASDGALLVLGRNGRVASKGKLAGSWSSWQDHSLLNETVRKGLTHGGDINSLLTAGTAGYTDVYTLTAGFTNGPVGAAVGDKIINACIDATNGAQIALLKNGKMYSRGLNAGVFSVWTGPTTPAVFESAQLTYANDTTASIAHGLGAIPKYVDIFAVCLTAQGGLAVGDVLRVTNKLDVWMTSTLVYYQTGVSIGKLQSGGTSTALTPANFRLIVRAGL